MTLISSCVQAFFAMLVVIAAAATMTFPQDNQFPDPCTPTKSASPARRSIWEIHPIYTIDVKVDTMDELRRLGQDSLEGIYV